MPSRRTFVSTAAVTSAAQFATAPLSMAAPSTPSSDADIFKAALDGDMKRATELANMNPWIAKLRATDGRTPLHYAVQGGHPEMVMFFSTKGADLSAGPESPLITAIEYPDPVKAAEMARSLLVNASDPNARRKDGKSALQVAHDLHREDIVQVLVHRGADTTGVSVDASKVDRVYFGKRYSYDAAGKPFHTANIDGLPQEFINDFVRLSHSDPDRVKHLLTLAPSLIAARATWDELGIEAAAHMGLVPLAKHLADHGAPVSTCTAAVLGLQGRVESLVKEDANCLRERGAHDIALLAFTAYGEQQASIADFLLRSGADVHARALGVTILHIAATKGYIELAEVLLAHGADINAVGRAMTPLAAAIKAKQDRMAEFLKSRKAREAAGSGDALY